MTHKQFSSNGGKAKTPAKKAAGRKNLEKARLALLLKRKAVFGAE